MRALWANGRRLFLRGPIGGARMPWLFGRATIGLPRDTVIELLGPKGGVEVTYIPGEAVLLGFVLETRALARLPLARGHALMEPVRP